MEGNIRKTVVFYVILTLEHIRRYIRAVDQSGCDYVLVK